MASVRAFLLVLSTAIVSLLAFETEYECTTKLSDIPEGSFYLRLSPATVTNTSSSNSSSMSSTCPGDDQRVTNLDCMCGDGLRNQQREIQERLERTCKYYEEHTDPISSPLGFCERALTQLGRCVTFEPFNSTDVELYNTSSLGMDVLKIDRIFSGYFGVVDRTLAGVYLRTEAHRCQCVELYKRWLCATKLTFYTSPPNSTSTDDDDDPTSSSDGAGMDESGGLGRLRPCIGVCEDVLQSCPYYHPSRFQGDKSVIYGGYPAFDCPRPRICGIQRENCSYGFGDECFGPRGSHGSTLTISFYTFIILQSLMHISIYL